MSLTTLAVLFSGVVIGLLLGLTGGGGSILTVPLLVYVVGLEPKVAISTSLLIVGLASLAALVPHSRSGNVVWRIGLLFGIAGMVGAYTGGRLAEYFADVVLLLIFAAVMIGCGTAMVSRRAADAGTAAAMGAGRSRSAVKIVIDGFIVGAVTGIVGAGGGFLVVPALALLGGLPMHAAVGTSLLVISLKCFAALGGYASHVPVDLRTAAIVSVLAIVGTLLGSRLSRRVSGEQLQFGFGIFVLVIASVLVMVEGSALLAAEFGVDRIYAGCGIFIAELFTAVIWASRFAHSRAQLRMSS